MKRQQSDQDISAGGAQRRSRPGHVVALLSLAFLLAIIDRMIFSLLIVPIKLDLGISDTQAGELAGIAFGLFYLLMGLPLGRLADRVNRPRLICAGLVLWSLATASCGLARTFSSLFAARVCVGVGEAAISPAAYSLLADYVPKSKLARAMSIYMMGTVAGVAIAWIAGGRIIAHLGTGVAAIPGVKPWGLIFFAAASPGLVLAPLLLTIRETRPPNWRPHPRSSDGKAVLLQLSHGRSAYAALFVAVAAINTYGFALLTWVPTMFAREFGWSLSRAGPVLGLAIGGAGLAGMYSAATAVDRLVRRNRPEISFKLMRLAAIAMLPFALTPTFSHSPVERLSLFLVPTMTLFFVLVGTAPTAVQMLTPAPLRGSVSAVYLFVVNLPAFAIGPTFVGMIADRYGGAAAGLASAIRIAGSICVPIAVLAFAVGGGPFERLARSEMSADDARTRAM